MRLVIALATSTAALTLAACGANSTVDTPIAQPADTPSTSAASTPAEAPKPVDLGDAEQVASKIKAQVDQVAVTKVYTEDDDPNHLLGRPNGYTSKVAFRDSRIDQKEQDGFNTAADAMERGGSVEVYEDEAGAQARKDYIQGLLKGGGLGSEYDYVRGGVIVRVTGELSPSKAKVYEAALNGLD